MVMQKILYSSDGNFRCRLLRKTKYSRRYAAESNTFDTVFRCNFETGGIAVFKLFAVPVCKNAANDGTHSVDNIFAGQIVGGSYSRRTCRLAVSLYLDNFCASQAKLHSRKCVYRVVYAAVARLKAAEQLRVRGIYYRSAFKRRDIAFPKIYSVRERFQIAYVGNSLFGGHRMQKLILSRKKFLGYRFRRADIHKRSEKPEHFVFIFGNGRFLSSFRKKIVYKIQ